MHEPSLVQNMFDIIEKDILNDRVEKLVKIIVELGPLSNVEPVLLIGAFDIMKRGTVFDGSVLEIERTESEVKCTHCGKVYQPESIPFQCPDCDQFGGQLLSGDEIIIKKIEMEVTDDG